MKNFFKSYPASLGTTVIAFVVAVYLAITLRPVGLFLSNTLTDFGSGVYGGTNTWIMVLLLVGASMLIHNTLSDAKAGRFTDADTAWSRFTQALHEKPELAWAWYCNLCTAMYANGYSAADCHEQARAYMWSIFGYDCERLLRHPPAMQQMRMVGGWDKPTAVPMHPGFDISAMVSPHWAKALKTHEGEFVRAPGEK